MNPFLIQNYHSPEYFCDRETETATLLRNIHNRSNTAFFAQRRLGKTALIQHVFYLLTKKKTACIYLDIYATQNLKDLSNQLANCIYNTFPENKSIGLRFWEAIKLLRPVVSIDDLSGAPELSLDITQPRQFEKSIPQLLQFLDAQKIPVVIAIDEFQQILNYPEKNVEAILRSTIQQLKNVSFVFCGSDQKMMHHLFNSASKPFYGSTKNIHLQKIQYDKYSLFIKQKFDEGKMKIDMVAIDSILQLTCQHTYFTQRLCHELYSEGHKTIKLQQVSFTLHRILTESEGTFYQYRNLITGAQWNLLKAIAKEEPLLKPYAQKFIYKYQLGTSANVKRSLDALLTKEMVYYNTNAPEPNYEVYDKFLMRWLQKKQFGTT
jgi:hypothetical protein